MRILFFLMVTSALAAAAPKNEMPTCNPESQSLVARATDCWNREDFGCAKLKIQNVLERQPGCAQAVWLNAFILDRDGKGEAAEAARKRAIELDPKLSDFWEERGHYIESDLSTAQEFSRFDLRFYGAQNRDKAWQAVKYLDEAYNELTSQFDFVPVKKILVIVFTTEEFMDAWRAPFIGGFFDRRDGKVRVRVDEIPGGEEEFRRVSRHEFTHAFMHQMYAKDLPLWFVEGSAQFYAYRNSSDGYWKEKRLEEIRKIARRLPSLSLKEVQHAIDKKGEVKPMEVYAAYVESEALVISVARDRGESWIPRLVNRLREGAAFPQAFEDVIGITPDRAMEHLQHDWQ